MITAIPHADASAADMHSDVSLIAAHTNVHPRHRSFKNASPGQYHSHRSREPSGQPAVPGPGQPDSGPGEWLHQPPVPRTVELDDNDLRTLAQWLHELDGKYTMEDERAKGKLGATRQGAAGTMQAAEKVTFLKKPREH